jgi:acetyltransferase
VPVLSWQSAAGKGLLSRGTADCQLLTAWKGQLTMVTIERLTIETAHVALANLVQLLRDAVDSGASIGFLPPLDGDTARRYWIQTIAELAGNTRVLLAARESGQIVGAIQLALATQQNAPHRAEVQKLMVDTRFRNQRIGRTLLTAAEEAARDAGRTLLVLDTRQGDVAERLYLKQARSVPAASRSMRGAPMARFTRRSSSTGGSKANRRAGDDLTILVYHERG